MHGLNRVEVGPKLKQNQNQLPWLSIRGTVGELIGEFEFYGNIRENTADTASSPCLGAETADHLYKLNVN